MTLSLPRFSPRALGFHSHRPRCSRHQVFLGPLTRREGISVHAVCLVSEQDTKRRVWVAAHTFIGYPWPY